MTLMGSSKALPVSGLGLSCLTVITNWNTILRVSLSARDASGTQLVRDINKRRILSFAVRPPL